MKKKAMELEMLGWWILAIVVLVISIIVIIILKGKGEGALKFISELIRFKA